MKEPIGSVIASGSIRNRMPMVGRLEVMVKPMPASVQPPHRALRRSSVSTLSLVNKRAVDVGDDERDAGHGLVLREALPAGESSSLLNDIVDDRLDRGVDRHGDRIFVRRPAAPAS